MADFIYYHKKKFQKQTRSGMYISSLSRKISLIEKAGSYIPAQKGKKGGKISI